VLADRAERSEEIDIARAEAAMERARKLRDEKNVDTVEFAALSAQIEKEMARLRVGRKQQKRVEKAQVQSLKSKV